MKAFLIFLLKLVLTGFCLWWAFSQVDFDQLGLHPAGRHRLPLARRGSRAGRRRHCAPRAALVVFLRGQSLPVSLGRAVELTMIDSLFSLASVSGLGGDAARILLLMRDHPGRKLVIAMAVMADHLAGLVSLAVSVFHHLRREVRRPRGPEHSWQRSDPVRLVLSGRRPGDGAADFHLRLAARAPANPWQRPLCPLAVHEADSGVV